MLYRTDDILENFNLLIQFIGGNACYYSVQNLLSSSLLSKKLKIKIH